MKVKKKSNSGDWILFIFYTKMRLKMQKTHPSSCGCESCGLKACSSVSPVFFISLKNYYIFHVCKSEYTCVCADVRWKSGGFSFLLPPCWFQGSIRSASSEAYPSPTEPSRCPFFTIINQSIKVCLFSTDNIVSSKFWLNLESSVKYTFSVSYCSLSRKPYLKGFGNRYMKVIAIGDISVLFFTNFIIVVII